MGESDYDRQHGDEPEPEVGAGQPIEEPQEPEVESQPEEAAGRALSQALKVSFTFLKLAMIALVGAYLVSGIFYVQPQEVRFKLRFGRVVPAKGEKVLRPGTGLYLRWPWEEVVTLPTDEQALRLDSEFWTIWPAESRAPGQQKGTLDVHQDGFLITGDKNIVHMKVLARYQLRSDARGVVAYRFGVEEPEAVLRRALMAATTNVVGSMAVMDVITNRVKLATRIEENLKARLAGFEKNAGIPLGLKVIRVEPVETDEGKNPTEPFAVAEAFYDAQNAASVRDLLKQEGVAEADRIVSQARAEAADIEAAALADRVRLVRAAQADAETMKKLLPIYNVSASVANILRENRYERAIEAVLRDSPGAFILRHPPGGTTQELRLMMGRTPVVKPAQERLEQM
ncbi:MAG: hypothetical protein KAX44_05415 [Candidatus Brocadiae bacterium]|nr:hypothetical protein [Candidatus Brocadiia bacterium]